MSWAPVSVDLRHFRAFVVVAEEGNIGRAATRLFITQPALSRQLHHLEEELGVQLFTRVPRGVELTDAGRELLDKARTALDAAEQALTIGRAAEPSGRLTLGISVAGSRHWYELAEAFTELHAKVDVETRTALSELLLRQVVAGELDVAIVLEPSHMPGISYATVREEPVFAWAHADHPLAGREEIELADLEGARVTLVGGTAGRQSGFNAAVRGLFDAAGVTPQYVEPPDLLPTHALRNGDALSLSVELDFPDDVRRLRLAGGHTMRYQVIHRTDVGTAAVRAFAAYAARHAPQA